MWEHANVPLPRWLRRASSVIATPDGHRLHHSAERRHRDCNIGTIFTLRDRIAGTWRGDDVTPEARFGLSSRPRVADTLGALLLDPLRSGDAWTARRAGDAQGRAGGRLAQDQGLSSLFRPWPAPPSLPKPAGRS